MMMTLMILPGKEVKLKNNTVLSRKSQLKKALKEMKIQLEKIHTALKFIIQLKTSFLNRVQSIKIIPAIVLATNSL